MENQAPLCPKCGKIANDVKVRRVSPELSFAAAGNGPPPRIRVYRCACGTAYTQAVQDVPRSSPDVGP
jgi:hypothetical protein